MAQDSKELKPEIWPLARPGGLRWRPRRAAFDVPVVLVEKGRWVASASTAAAVGATLTAAAERADASRRLARFRLKAGRSGFVPRAECEDKGHHRRTDA